MAVRLSSAGGLSESPLPDPESTASRYVESPGVCDGNRGDTSLALDQPGYKFVVASVLDPNGNRIKIILTDLEYAQIIYTGRVNDPDLWDSHFLNAAASYLGSWLVNPLARNAEVLKEQIAIATSIIEQARLSDGNEGMTSIDHTPDWMAVRGAVGYEILGNPGFFGGWDSIGFPGGILV